MLTVFLTGCGVGKTASISLFNHINENVNIVCYYNVQSKTDSVFICANDSSKLGFYSAPWFNYKKIRNSYIEHMDSIIIQAESKTVKYRNKKYIYDFLIHNKDTANIIRTRVDQP